MRYSIIQNHISSASVDISPSRKHTFTFSSTADYGGTNQHNTQWKLWADRKMHGNINIFEMENVVPHQKWCAVKIRRSCSRFFIPRQSDRSILGGQSDVRDCVSFF